MSKFNFQSEDERQRAVNRALSLKPKVDGVYANKHGYVIDQPNGTTEVLVSFKNLDTLLGTSETSPTESSPEVVIVAEAAPANAAVEVNTDNTDDDVTEEVEAVTETKEERRARRAAEKAAKAAE